MTTSGITQRISWEFLMPQRKPHLRVVGYPRVSDESVRLDSGTIESQSKAIKAYVTARPEMILTEIKPEAMTAYMKPFKQRPVFMEIMDLARKGQIHGVVVTEFSRLSRRQAEQAVIVNCCARIMSKSIPAQRTSMTQRLDNSCALLLLLVLRVNGRKLFTGPTEGCVIVSKQAI